MNDNQRRMDQRNKKELNGWKWAFLLLVVFITVGVVSLAINIRPVSINKPNTAPLSVPDENIELSTRLNKNDTEQLINTYLDAAVGEDFENYTIVLTNQLEIHGSVFFLGVDIPFSLYLDPYVTENGNIQLRGESVEVASFSLPVSAVMSLVANQIDFPDFVAVDSEEQLIVINLNELTQPYNFDVQMTQIDLEADVLELNLRINEGTLSNQIQLESVNE